jgi:AraC family transcriptional regulator
MEQRTSTQEDYLKRINSVIDYIHAHLDEDIDIERLAETAHFSRWHFQRIMTAFLGEPVWTYIMRRRVTTAAGLLRTTALPIGEIACKVGYDAPSSLTKAFRLFHNTSPAAYRNNKNLTLMQTVKISKQMALKAPKIITLEPKNAIYLELRGAYAGLDFGGAYQKLWNYVKTHKTFGKGIEHICLYYTDPTKATGEQDLLTHVCLVVPKAVEEDGEIRLKTIAGGKYAKFTYIGPYTGLHQLYDAIYGKWLPESGHCTCGGCAPKAGDCDCGCILRDAPCFEKYINQPGKTPPEKLKTEIYVPIT